MEEKLLEMVSDLDEKVDYLTALTAKRNPVTMVDVNGIKVSMPCNEIMEALAKMQGQLDNAKKESKNPFFNSKYADLANCLQTAKKPMADNGLSLSQHCTYDGAFVTCVTILGHASGQMMVSTLNVPVARKDPQGVGSSITYARRYALTSIIGLAQEDDDGNAASQKQSEEKKDEPKNVEKRDEPKKTEQLYVRVDGNEVSLLYPTFEDAKKHNLPQNYLPLSGFNANQCKYALSRKEYESGYEFINKKLEELTGK